MVDFANGAIFLIDVADFAAQQKAYRRLSSRRYSGLDRCGHFWFETEKPLLRWLELALEFSKPTGMGNVAGSDDLYTFELSPLRQVFQVQIFAGGT